MNQENNSKLALRYAQAFIAVYGDQLTLEVCERLLVFKDFLINHAALIYFFTIPTLDSATKEKGLDFLSKKFELPSTISPLMALLLASKRIILLPRVLRYITELYKKEHNISTFVINSSHHLSAQDLALLQEFLARHTGGDIIYAYKEDKDLIAGIRMWSDNYLWERSIARQLRSIQLSLIR